MGRTCRICGHIRPNERFGGKGMRAIICSKCLRIPKKERRRILATDEVHGFMLQKNISAKNIRRLNELEVIEDDGFQSLRELVLEIATLHPRKRGRGRWRTASQKHPKLFARIVSLDSFSYLRDTFCYPPENETIYGLEEEDLVDAWWENYEP